MFELFVLALVALIFGASWLDSYTWHKSHEEVIERYANGDRSCGVIKTFYGWRVKEYAECDL